MPLYFLASFPKRNKEGKFVPECRSHIFQTAETRATTFRKTEQLELNRRNSLLYLLFH